MPHYLAAAFQVNALDHNPWDVVVGVAVIFIVAAVRLVRRPTLYGIGIIVPALDLLTQIVLVALGFVFVFSTHTLTHGTSLGHAPSWRSLAFALPLGMLAYSGLDTVANLAEETRRPGVDLPRSLFVAIGTVVVVYVAIATVAVSAFPGPNTELGTRWLRSPLVGVATRIRAEIPEAVALETSPRFFVGASGALILVASVTTSIGGVSRIAATSLGEHGQLPSASSGGLKPGARSISPQAIV